MGENNCGFQLIFISKNITSVYYFEKQDSREKLSLSKLVTTLSFRIKMFQFSQLGQGLGSKCRLSGYSQDEMRFEYFNAMMQQLGTEHIFVERILQSLSSMTMKHF